MHCVKQLVLAIKVYYYTYAGEGRDCCCCMPECEKGSFDTGESARTHTRTRAIFSIFMNDIDSAVCVCVYVCAGILYVVCPLGKIVSLRLVCLSVRASNKSQQDKGENGQSLLFLSRWLQTEF